MATWTVSANNDTALTAYKSMRLAQDDVVVDEGSSLAEMFMVSWYKPSGDVVRAGG